MDIKEIALKAGLANFDSYQDDGKTLMVAEFDVTDQVIRTVESAVAELAKQNEPVAFTNSAQLGYVTSGQHQDIPLAMWSRNTSYSGADIQLYTFPPTAEQIANETAEAIAKFVAFQRNDIPATGIEFAEVIRSGAWRKLVKEV